MKFQDYEYKRPDLDEITGIFNRQLSDFNEVDPVEQIARIRELNKIRNTIDTASNLVYIRNSINTEDAFYEKEMQFIDENSPKFQELNFRFYKALLSSPHRKELEEVFGALFFRMMENQVKTFSPEIMDDMVTENKLVTQYNKLIASAKIEFDGKINNLSDMAIYLQNKDRAVRQAASEKYNAFFTENLDTLDDLYDQLVKIRDKMAKKLGFENYIPLGYMRLGRIDYGAEEVAAYRDQILRDVVPLAEELKARQKKRIGIEDFKYYDAPLKFLSGNANPHGDADFIVENARQMYKELGHKPHEFFEFMTGHDLFDLLSRPGKMSGGYCTYIADYKSPFIFANFNGTSHDVEVMTHEAGHAYQVYMSRDYELPEYIWPTYEACEIHSMSMEFLTWPWMDLFFKEDTEKFKFNHLASCVTFLPYGVTVDEFQHHVYAHPELTPEQRRRAYSEIERKYMPSTDYDGVPLLENGGYFFRQGHIFNTPFYYIDYTLAQVCAFQFFNKAVENREKAMEDYDRLCAQGGSQSFLSLLKTADLDNPFEDGTIKKTLVGIRHYLDGVDDTKL